jgi:hypothetical protein
MELVGSEKKLQALFRELKLADEVLTPDFCRVWSSAQTRPAPRAFKFSLALVTALILVTLVSLGLWSRPWQRSQPAAPIVAATSGSMPVTLIPTGPTVALGPKSDRVRRHRSDRKFSARRSSAPAASPEAASISTWQSPTATLMKSPADDMLTSLPQLDSSLTELKTFLPMTPQ